MRKALTYSRNATAVGALIVAVALLLLPPTDILHVALLGFLVIECTVSLAMAWLKYRHQRATEEAIAAMRMDMVEMRRILTIADNVLFNQSRFLPMMGAIADIHESVCGPNALQKELRATTVNFSQPPGNNPATA